MANAKKPRCPSCGKALYRTENPGDKRKEDTYVYCRYAECGAFGDIRKQGFEIGECWNTSEKKSKETKRNNSEVSVGETLFDGGLDKNVAREARRKKRKRRAVPARSELKEDSVVVAARKATKDILSSEYTKKITVISMVVMLQELGDVDVADILVGRYCLEKYGFKRSEK